MKIKLVPVELEDDTREIKMLRRKIFSLERQIQAFSDIFNDTKVYTVPIGELLENGFFHGEKQTNVPKYATNSLKVN